MLLGEPGAEQKGDRCDPREENQRTLTAGEDKPLPGRYAKGVGNRLPEKLWTKWGLILAEHAGSARSAATTSTARGAGWRHFGVRVCRSFGDRARASTDEAVDVSAARGAELEGRVRHFLACFEVT
jgi:hypothetical protein